MAQNLTTYAAIVVLYVIGLAAIGYIEYRRVDTASDYIVAGRKLGSAVTGLSEIFSAYSGFWLIGVTGFAYVVGSWAWIAVPSQAFGWALMYFGQGERLRRSSEDINEETIPSYLGSRWDSKGILGVGAIAVTILYMVYVAAQTSAAAKAVVPFFNIDYVTAAVIMGAIITLYTISGGFLAVAWSDFLQGILVIIGSTVMAIWAVAKVGGVGALYSKLANVDPAFVAMDNGQGGIVLFGSIALWFLIGLAYVGNPHVLVRFLAIESDEKIRRAMIFSGAGQIIVTSTSVFIGLSARILIGGGLENTELAFPTLATQHFPAWFGGFVLVSALGLIMSTADSQLLVGGTAFSRDFYERFLGKEISDDRSKTVARGAVAVIGAAATIVAALQIELVLWMIAFAWSTLGAVFGPAVFATLWWKRATREGVLASMVAGLAVGVFAQNFMTASASKWFIAWNLWPFVASIGTLIVVSLATDTREDHAQHVDDISSGGRAAGTAAASDDD